MKREMLNISLSYGNRNAVIVMNALKSIPVGQRSAAILEWAAAHLEGKTISAHVVSLSDIIIPEDEFDDLIDNM